MVSILTCTSKRELKTFERLPETIHRKDPYFVPPFPGTVVKMVGPKSPFRRHGEIHAFLAYQDGNPVGRIAAITNRSHNEYHKDKVGFFGYFDCIEDNQVAQRLLEKARETLQEKGCDSMRGPYNPSSNDECGLLVEGFESAPFFLMTYNPPYYLNMYDSVGLKPIHDQLAFYVSAETKAPARVEKIVNRVRKSSQIAVRSLDIARLDEELVMIKDLFNSTICDVNWGFFPIMQADLEDAAKDLKAILDPDMLMIAEKHGKPIGFCLTIPNINEFLWKVKNSPVPIRVLRFLWLLKTKHPKEARLTLLGVHPEYRNTGIAALFYYETLMRGKKKYIGGELSWVDEDNKDLIKSIRVMGGQHYKTYRIYESSLVH